ncbi:phosphoribosylformylglycinamidine synthase [Wenzhouxiangella sp. AB-CW3]|uniref:phosphoribosylformylglycinamidine synthase n=1 Tax=Wenzhouxiangella sp. AB-CW3 TaxID=2771012 RepID=UPI00168A8C96|nr:phosphoribosylformylglycinamidine synthase [Wenzhouxiangella sp. AB-CW3]QOC23039.1 phosphoribosylformylglycinamidine synthase [Wenzhouxiangella sp. AB-CW3]
MIFLPGRRALPQFRLEQLADAISEIQGRRIGLHARDLYLLGTDRLPDEPDGSRLRALLGADGATLTELTDVQLLVAPRPGTVTPWASRARDILRRCGLGRYTAIERGVVFTLDGVAAADLTREARNNLHDRMTQIVVDRIDTLAGWFELPEPAPLGVIALGDDPSVVLSKANGELGLALSNGEIDYLAEAYSRLQRDPTDAELMMFAQANSEHCRHKIFNATWTVDGQPCEPSLFKMIRSTHAATPGGTLVAYDDNAAVVEGFDSRLLVSTDEHPAYDLREGRLHIQIKVETHNHPTAISPEPGAATGSGGEIRDESATGRGARPVAALTGFSVSDLRIPGHVQPWENLPEPPSRMASSLQIMTEGPIGGARFNNEFGRPALLGYFRSFAARVDDRLWGYHKPIMIAGGSGIIADGLTHKQPLSAGDRIIVLGGPAMLIGLGGGAASSMSSGQSDEDLDFASVQRGNPEMQRRAQEVIDRCWQRGERNPIKSIHDVGAGGLSNALPELLHDGGVGGRLELREIPTNDRSMSPMALWCNESQERYVLAISPDDLETFAALCERERCPWADLGAADADGQLRLDDRLLGTPAVDMPLDMLLGKPPSMHRDVQTRSVPVHHAGLENVSLAEAADRVLALPGVGSKQFLITIGDRSVGGLTVRDQMVGPHQVPVANCAISLLDYEGYAGSAMSMGERTPLAIWDSPAAARMAVGEAVTNLAGTRVPSLDRVKLSANWMAAAGADGQDAALRSAVEAVAEFCPRLDLSIPVGKDSLSMQTVWNDDSGEKRMCAPVSLIVSAFAPVPDVRRHLTPQLDSTVPSRLLLLDLGRQRLGGSALAQVFGRELGAVPDVDDPDALKRLFNVVQSLIDQKRILALHDRSDGGLFVTVLEMALAGHCGVDLHLPCAPEDAAAFLFNEELGLVLQVADEDEAAVRAALEQEGLAAFSHDIGQVSQQDRWSVSADGQALYSAAMPELAQRWGETSYRIQRLRDHPECADEEFATLADWSRPGLAPNVEFDVPAPAVLTGARPRVAILREQGVNGQREMARAFMTAGFEAVDVHMSDLESGRQRLDEFQGLAACGGFSFGDVLGAGQGWARSILFNPVMRDHFEQFLVRSDRFALGVCNGCQMLSALREIIPGTSHWPAFVHNRSRQFEARLNLVRIDDSPSLFLTGMSGSRLPVVTSHGEGRASFEAGQDPAVSAAIRYAMANGKPAVRYPDNPNGSPDGITGVCNEDGRVTIMMPHPERLLRTVNFSWAPRQWGEQSPWMKMFHNARQWVA